jgi:Big-like domain-containing protein
VETALHAAGADPPFCSREIQEFSTMKSATLLALVASLATLASLPAYATCPVPTSPGATICFPSNASTVTYPMNIEGSATGRNGLPIVQMILYSDNQKIYEVRNTDTFTFSDGDDLYNQSYHLVLNAWDSAGNLFQASTTVKQIDGLYACSHPASGINFCAPPNGSYQPSDNLQLTAWASSNVTSMNAWQNGTLVDTMSGDAINAVISGTVNDTWQNFTVKAYSGSRLLYTASSNYKLYYAYECGRSNCSPGVVIQEPTNDEDTNSPFTVEADVENNTQQITAMKVYLDNNVVGTSSGPTIRANVTAAAGTHLLSVQAWDTTGALYKTDQTVNVY